MADIQSSIVIDNKTFTYKAEYQGTLTSWTEQTDKALLANRSLSGYVDNSIKNPINNANSSTSPEAELKSLSRFVVQCVKMSLLDDAHQTLRVLEDSLKDNPQVHLEVLEKYILAFVKYQDWIATETGRLAYNLLLEKYESLLTRYEKDASKKTDLLAKITAKVMLASSVQGDDNQKVLGALEISRGLIETAPEAAAPILRTYAAYFMKEGCAHDEGKQKIIREIEYQISQLPQAVGVKTLLQTAIRVLGDNLLCAINLIKRALKAIDKMNTNSIDVRDQIALLTPYIARLVIMIKARNPEVAKNLSVHLIAQSTDRNYQPQYTVLPRAAYQLLPKKNLAQAGDSQ